MSRGWIFILLSSFLALSCAPASNYETAEEALAAFLDVAVATKAETVPGTQELLILTADASGDVRVTTLNTGFPSLDDYDIRDWHSVPQTVWDVGALRDSVLAIEDVQRELVHQLQNLRTEMSEYEGRYYSSVFELDSLYEVAMGVHRSALEALDEDWRNDLDGQAKVEEKRSMAFEIAAEAARARARLDSIHAPTLGPLREQSDRLTADLEDIESDYRLLSARVRHIAESLGDPEYEGQAMVEIAIGEVSISYEVREARKRGRYKIHLIKAKGDARRSDWIVVAIQP